MSIQQMLMGSGGNSFRITAGTAVGGISTYYGFGQTDFTTPPNFGTLLPSNAKIKTANITVASTGDYSTIGGFMEITLEGVLPQNFFTSFSMLGYTVQTSTCTFTQSLTRTTWGTSLPQGVLFTVGQTYPVTWT